MNTREQFGKYLLLKKLTEDPMGETFRAGMLGDGGIFGGGGDDLLTAGAGSDRLLFAGEHGEDTITDFDVMEDEIGLANAMTEFTSLDDVMAATTSVMIDGQSAIMIDTGAGSVTLLGVDAASLTADNFVF